MSYLFIEKILKLKIKRTASTNAYCCFSGCKIKTKLKVLSNEFRYNITKDTKVYIPSLARACEIHFNRNNWLDVGDLIEKDKTKFTAQQLESMFTLLTDTNVENTTKIERECFKKFEIQIQKKKLFNVIDSKIYSWLSAIYR